MKAGSVPVVRFRHCPGIDVEFRVVIHEEWKIDLNQQKKSVHIQFQTPELGNWKWNYVDMVALELVQ